MKQNKFSKLNCIIYAVTLVLVISCSEKKDDRQSVVQISTIDALMQGIYDGNTSLSGLKKYGNFGIGTFHALDGEMIFLDNSFYQVKADGKVYKPLQNVLSPFATVTFFNPDNTCTLSEMSYANFKPLIDSLMGSSNFFYAIKMHGTFRRVKTRSVPSQHKPYPPLVKVTVNQPEFESRSVTGTVSGFYCPPFVTGINVPGYHLHFLSDNHDFGGHILEFELEKGVLWLDKISDFRLILPQNGGFRTTDLTKDLSKDLKNVEGGK